MKNMPRSAYILTFLSALLFLSGCKEPVIDPTTPIWEATGDSISFSGMTYEATRTEMMVLSEGAVVGMADYPIPRDTVLGAKKVKLFSKKKKGNWNLKTPSTSETDWIAQGGIFASDGKATIIATLYIKEGGPTVLTREWIKGVWTVADTLKVRPLTNISTHHLKISEDGSTLAVFTPLTGYNKPFIQTYRRNSGTWVTMGDPIPVRNLLPLNPKFWGTGNYWDFVDFNANGTVIAFGDPFSEVNGPSSGMVCLHEWKQGKWNPLGDPIYGKFPHHQFGATVTLHQKQLLLTVGSHSRKFEANKQLLKFEEGRWKEQKDAFKSAIFTGKVYAINKKGTVLFTANSLPEYAGEFPAELGIYHKTADEWTFLGQLKNTIGAIKEFEFVPSTNELFILHRPYPDQHIVRYTIRNP